MLLIPCPYCGPRAEIEFAYGGEAGLVRDDPVLENFLYLRVNARGPHAERWQHLHGCGRFFNVVRDTLTDRILAAYRVGEPRPE